jgi:hypothetical protein
MSPEGPSDEIQVRQTFEGYTEALLAGNGAEAAELVTEGTIAYYEDMRLLATTAGPAEIRAQNLANQLMITILRADPGPDRLQAMDGGEVMAYAIERGYIGRGDVRNAAMGDLTVTGDVATAPVLDGAGNPTELSWDFLREDGAWKFDVTALLPTSNDVLKGQAKKEGLPEDEFVLRNAESITDSLLTPAIWEAPKA